MCVIFGITKGNTIPFDNYLKPASLRNRDGWGVSYTDRGKFIVEKFYDEKGNDPEKIAKWLEETKDFDRCLHVRFTTRGNKGLENVHPFKILDSKDFGEGLVLYHNGTLSGWGQNDGASDSNQFANDFVKPLAERFIRGSLEKDYSLLADNLFKKVLESEISSYSVVTLHSESGNILNIDKNNSIKRYTEMGFWSSNDSYFDIKRTYNYNRQGTGGTTTYPRSVPFLEHQSNDSPNEKEKDSKEFQQTQTITSNNHSPDTSLSDWYTAILSVNENFPVVSKDHDRDTFFSLANLKDFDDIRYMGPEEIQELIERFPEHANILIQDLIWLYVNILKDVKKNTAN